MYNDVLSSWATEQKFDLKIMLLKSFRRIPQETKIFYHEQLSHKISNSEFIPNYGIFKD